MKKLLILILALVMCLTAFTACDFSFLTPVEPEVEYHIDKAESFLKNMYKDVNSVTPNDYEVVGNVKVAGVDYSVTWTVDTDKVKVEALENGNYLINVDEKSETKVDYKLTATIKAGNGDTATVVYERTVPEYNVLSFEEYMAAAKGEVVTIEGIVVAMNSVSAGNKRNHLFLADANGNGGYYCYQMVTDPVEDGIEIGMTVAVSGEVAPYSGMQEIKNCTAVIVDKTIKTVAPLDLTTEFETGADLKNYVGRVVTVKGVDIGKQDLAVETSQYLYFSIGDTESYIRTYLTDLSHNIANADAKKVIDEAHAAHYDWTANVTGILVLYSGNPYLIPVDTNCFEWIEYVEKTPEYKVNKEFNKLTFETTFPADTVVDLVTTGKYYSDVTISWESNSELAVVADGKLTVTVPETDTEIKITATITCGEQTKTKEFTVLLSRTPISIADALALADGASVYVAGEVIEINTEWSDQYGNISVTISDGTDTLYVFRMSTKVVVGDIITITGKMGTYNGARQVAAGSTAEITDPAPVEATIEEAKALDDGRRVIVSGTVKSVDTEWSDKYGNISVTITDGTNDLYVFRLATKVAVGDSITITGKMGTYDGARQIAAGATAKFNHTYGVVGSFLDSAWNKDYAMTEGPDGTWTSDILYLVAGNELKVRQDGAWDVDFGKDGVAKGSNITVETTGYYQVVFVWDGVSEGASITLVRLDKTVEEALAAEDGTLVVVVGSVLRVDTAWSDKYGNITVTIGDATGTLYVYRLATKVEVGQVITITGEVGSYNGAKQIAAGATATIDETHTHTFTEVKVDSTCVVAGTITYTCECGTTIVETLALAAHSTNEESVWTVVTAPTCNTIGSEKATCAVCNDAEVTRDVAALGHTVVDGVCSVCEKKVEVVSVNVSDLTAGTTTDAELVTGTGITASAGLAIDSNSKEIDGFTFTQRLKLGGTMKVDSGVVKAGVKIVVDGPATIVVYGMSSSKDATRTLRLCTLSGTKFTSLYEHTNVVGSAIGKYVFTVDAAGTYYLGSASSGINLYYIAVQEVVVETPDDTTADETFAIVASAGTLSTDSTSVSWSSENFTYVAEKGTNNNNPRVTDTDHFRIYQGNNFSITGKAGEKITKVVFTTLSASYAEVLATSLNNTAGYTATVDGSVVTVVIEGGTTSVTFTTTAQTRINNIVITYEK